MFRITEDNQVLTTLESRAILVGIALNNDDVEASMDELESLAEADGVTVLGRMVQQLARPNGGTLIGSGKVLELAELCKNMEADTVIFNEELSGIQLRNLEDALEARVLDRTILILDIFASRAVSREGKCRFWSFLVASLMGLGVRIPATTSSPWALGSHSP